MQDSRYYNQDYQAGSNLNHSNNPQHDPYADRGGYGRGSQGADNRSNYPRDSQNFQNAPGRQPQEPPRQNNSYNSFDQRSEDNYYRPSHYNEGNELPKTPDNAFPPRTGQNNFAQPYGQSSGNFPPPSFGQAPVPNPQYNPPQYDSRQGYNQGPYPRQGSDPGYQESYPNREIQNRGISQGYQESYPNREIQNRGISQGYQGPPDYQRPDPNVQGYNPRYQGPPGPSSQSGPPGPPGPSSQSGPPGPPINNHYRQDFNQRDPQLPQRQNVDASSTSNYNFHNSLNKNIPPQRRANENTPIEILPPNRNHLENSELTLSKHPFDKIIQDASAFLLQNGIDPDLPFREADPGVKYVVIKRDFISIVGAKWGLVKASIASAEEIEMIADIFDFFKNNYIYYVEFCKKIRNPEYRIGGPELARKIDPAWREKMYRILAEAVFAKNFNYEEIFRRNDLQRTGQMRLAEFVTCVMSLNSRLNPQEITLLADEFDPRHEGLVVFQRFLNVLDEYVGKKKTYDEIVKRMEKFSNDKLINIEAKVQEIDPRDSKLLTKDDFLSIINKINFYMSPIEMQTFCEEIPKNKDGLLDLRYLMQRLPKPKALLDMVAVYEKIKSFVRSSHQTLTAVFAKFDKNGDGSLGPFEFSQALSEMGISSLTSSEITLIIQDLDKDHDGSVSVTEFADKLGMSVDLIQTTVSHEFFRKINVFLKNRGLNLQDFFRQYDYDRNNSLNKPEFSKMLAYLGLGLSEIDIEKLYNELDANHDGRVTFMEFMTKFEKSIGIIDKRDKLNKQKILRAMKGKHPKDVFKSRYDPETKENIFTIGDMKEGINFMGLNFTENDVEHIIDDMGQGKNHATMGDLMAYFSLQQPQDMKTNELIKKDKPHWAEKWIKQIRDYKIKQQIPLEKLFMSFNADGTGKLTMAELAQALDDMTFNITDSDKLRFGNEIRKGDRIFIKDIITLIENNTAPLDNLIEELRNYFRNTGKRIEEIFSVNGNDIYRAEFAEGLATINRDIDIARIGELMMHLNPDIKNLGITNQKMQKISVASLSSLLQIKLETTDKRSLNTSRRIEIKIIEGIYQKIAECVIEKKINIDRFIPEQYDKYGTNRISVENFYKIIDDITDRGISMANVKILENDLDNTNSGSIKYPGFIAKIHDGIIYNSFAEKFLTRIKKQTLDKGVNISVLYNEPTGMIGFMELFDLLRKTSLDINKEELKKFCSGMDADDVGKINYKEFVQKVYDAGESFPRRRPVDERKFDRGSRAENLGYREKPEYEEGKYKPENSRDYIRDESNFERDPRDYNRGQNERDRDKNLNVDRGRDFADKGRDFGDRGRDFADKVRDFGDKGRDFADKGRDFADKGRDFADKGRDFADKGRDFADKGRDFPDKGRDFPDRSRDFGDRSRDFGDKGRDFGDKSRDFGDKGNDRDQDLYRDRSREFGDKSYDRDREFTREKSREYDDDRNREYTKDRSREYGQDKEYNKDSREWRREPDRREQEDRRSNSRNREDPYQKHDGFDSRNLTPKPSEDFGYRSVSPAYSRRPLRGPKQHWAKSYIQIIQEYASRKQLTTKQLFQEFDLDRSNSLTTFEFAKALDSMGVKISQKELQNFMEELDSNRDGRISLTEFEKILGKRDTDDRIEAKLEEFRDVIKRDRVDLRRLFAVADRDRSNYLSYEEFEREVGQMYPRFNRYDLEDIARYLDINHDGRILYHEFVGRILIEEIEELNKRVADFIKKSHIDITEVFSNLDYINDKCIHFDQFLEAFGTMKLPLTREESMKLVLENPLHRTRDNRFSYEDLIDRLPLVDDLSKIYDQIRKVCTEKMIKANEIFEKYDVNNDKALTPKMFFEAFSSLGGNLKSTDYTKLMDSLEKGKDGKILYKKFLKKLKSKKGKKKVDIYKRLKKEIQSKNMNFFENLRSFDTYGDKMISKSNLKEIFVSNSINITEEDLDFIWSELDRTKTNLINYEELFNKIKPKYSAPKTTGKTIQPKEPHWAQRYLDEIQRYVKGNNMKLKELFTRFDRDHSNSVSINEFSEALRDIRVNIPYQDMQKLVDELMPTQDGQISLTNFEKLFPEFLENERKLDRLYYLIRRVANDKKIDLQGIFSSKDLDMQGFLVVSDFLECIKQIQPDCTPIDLRSLADSLDPKRSNKIIYQDFIKKIELGGIELVNMKVREFLQTSKISFVKAFDENIKNDYFLPPNVIRKVLEGLRMPLTAEEIAMLIHDNNLTKAPDGRLSVKDLADRIGVRERFPDPRPSPSAIFERLRRRWQEGRIDPIGIFRDFDYEKDQHLTRSNFSQALYHAGTPLTAIEIEVVWELLEKTSDGRSSVEHFVRLVNGIDDSSNSIFSKIYNFIDTNKIDLLDVLTKYDTDRDRQVTMFEMENALKSVRLSLTDHEYKSVFSDIDKTRSGRIYIADFVRRVMKDAPKVDLNAISWAVPIFSNILQSLNDYKSDSQAYFRRYNVERDGSIALQEFRNALYKLGIDPAATQSQRLINYFKDPTRESVSLKDFDYALKALGRVDSNPQNPSKPIQPFQPIQQATSLRFKVLTRDDLETLYQCLDYISSTIVSSKKVTVTVYVEKKFTQSISFDDIKVMVKIDLQIPSEDDILNDLCLLLDCGRGYVQRPTLLDALSGVRVEQVLPSGTQPFREPVRNEQASYLSIPNRSALDSRDFRQSSPRGIMKPPGQAPGPVKILYDFLNVNRINLAKLLGRDSGPFPKAAFVKLLRDERIMREGEIIELCDLISLQGNQVDLTRLSTLLSECAKPGIKMDPYLLLKESIREQKTTFNQLFGSNPSIHKDAFYKSLNTIRIDRNLLNTIATECRGQDPQFIDLRYLQDRMEGIVRPPPRPESIQRPPIFPQSPKTAAQNLIDMLNAELIRAEVTSIEMFSKYDIDNDGVLSLDEFIEAFKTMRTMIPDQKLIEAFSILDTNNSKTISINELSIKMPGYKASLERRITNLDLGQRFDEEVREIFAMLDRDKDGSIDYNEIILGIKAYCILPSQNQTKEIMGKIDKNRNGKIEYEEFKSFVEDTVKREILRQEDEMQDVRQKFIHADIMKNGYLTPDQLLGVLKSTKADVNQEELNHLLSYVDADKNGKIDIDEFVLLMSGASPEVFADPRASSIMFNIRKSRKISPMDFFKIFQDMPSHFLPSFISEQHKMKRILPSSDIVPALDPSGLHFRDVNPIASKSKVDSITYLKQNPCNNGGYITLIMASGISIPDGLIVQRACILKRFVRITHWSSLTQKYIGNSIFIESTWREQLEDRWTFEIPTDKDFNIFTARISNEMDVSKIFLIFEFIIVFCKENLPIEMSCGFAKIDYRELMMRTSHKVLIHGGTPDNEQNINPDDIRTFRSGWRHALKMTGLLKITSQVEFNIKFPIKCTILEQGAIEALPEVSVMNKQGLGIVRLYREYLAELFSRSAGKNFTLPNIADSFLTQFPKILDCPDTWMQIVAYWNSMEFSNLLGRNRNDANCLANLQSIINRLYSSINTDEFALDDIQVTRFSYGVINNRVNLYDKRMDIISKAIKNTQDVKMVSYKPFDIMEIKSTNIIDTDYLMSKKVRSITKRIAETAPNGFGNVDGRRGSRTLSQSLKK
ncbi:hypothetical protein SteCoe_19609 [Stentor coeruleus]|uniref:EF-hand domain-containing protein n=1 Tax=Stentor coeruleus TaxID=5963 RepID=A0A1R2BTQ6_9CILI|nr:hypothetical protein SteCoe_19609 [Stentor coeruleus]